MNSQELVDLMDRCEALHKEQEVLAHRVLTLSHFKEVAAKGESLIEVGDNAPESWQRAAERPYPGLSPEGEEKLYEARMRLIAIAGEIDGLIPQVDALLGEGAE